MKASGVDEELFSKDFYKKLRREDTLPVQIRGHKPVEPSPANLAKEKKHSFSCPISQKLHRRAFPSYNQTYFIMPIATNLDHQFSSLSMTDCHTKDDGVPANLVSPAKSESGNSIFSTNSDDDASEDDGINMLAHKTEHKLMEEQGMLKDEPLLKENPYRFVLFPIQDNDVSYLVANCKT